MSSLQIEVRDRVGWLTFNRPHNGNAIDQDLVVALDRVLDWAQEAHNRIRCLVLTGAGKHFCSGVDLRSMQALRTGTREDAETMARGFLDHTVERMLNLRIPIVAAVNGAAAGTGMTLALTADVIVMSENAFFLPSFARLGLVPDNGITWLLPERIGASRARAVLMLGDRIEARTAGDWGLAYRVVPPEALAAAAGECASRLAAGPPNVLGATRMLLNRCDARVARGQIHAERQAHTDALAGREHVEGLAAFFERREPRF